MKGKRKNLLRNIVHDIGRLRTRNFGNIKRINHGSTTYVYRFKFKENRNEISCTYDIEVYSYIRKWKVDYRIDRKMQGKWFVSIKTIRAIEKYYSQKVQKIFMDDGK